jgi:cytochrome c553
LLRRPSWLSACALLLMLLGVLPLHAAGFEDTLAQRLLACSGCHGANGRAEGNVYFPRIAGKPAGYLLNQLRNFRDGRRNYTLMTGMVEFLRDDYLQEIAQHFSVLDLPYPAPPVSSLSDVQQARARQLVTQGAAGRKLPACTSCHGEALTGLAPHVPGLLGLPRDYINAQLGAWKTGQRHAHAPDCMAEIARVLTTDEVALVSGWLATQALPADTHAVSRISARPDAPQRPVCGSAPELAGKRS